MDIKDFLPLIGVVIGGVIAIIGNLLTVLIQRNQERIKFQKEIYDVRFMQTEEYLRDYLAIFKSLREGLDEEDYYDGLEKIIYPSLNTITINSLEITEDVFIKKEIENLKLCNSKARELAIIRQRKHEYVPLGDLFQMTVEVENACSGLKIAIDKFRLRGYKPKKQFFLIRFWNWLTKRKAK